VSAFRTQGIGPERKLRQNGRRAKESPRWLLARGRQDEARRMLRSRTELATDEEIAEIKALGDEEHQMTFRDLRSKQLRPAVMLGVVVAATNQLVGVNAVIYYTPTLLTRAGFGDSAAILSTVGIGLVHVMVTVLALSLVDRVGRRPLLLGGTAVVVLDLVLLGALYLLPSQTGVVGVLVVMALCVYIAAFAASLGMGIWLINSEIFPTAVRGKAAGVGTVTHWSLDFVISLTVLTMIGLLSATGLFWLYAVFGSSASYTCTGGCRRRRGAAWKTSSVRSASGPHRGRGQETAGAPPTALCRDAQPSRDLGAE
jgi:Sugar (and other) transporter